MAAAKDAQQNTPAWQDRVVAWYEREFPLPERHGPGPQPMLRGIAEGVVALDPQHRITLVNEVARQLLARRERVPRSRNAPLVPVASAATSWSP